MDSFNPSPGLSILGRRLPKNSPRINATQRGHDRPKRTPAVQTPILNGPTTRTGWPPFCSPKSSRHTQALQNNEQSHLGTNAPIWAHPLAGRRDKDVAISLRLVVCQLSNRSCGHSHCEFQVGLIITEKHAASNLNPKPRDSRLTGERALRPSRSIATKPIAQTR